MVYKIFMANMFICGAILQIAEGSLNLAVSCYISAGLFAIASSIADK